MTGVARLNLADNEFVTDWYYDPSMPKTQSVAVYGDYVYATAFGKTNTYIKPMNILQIKVDDPSVTAIVDTNNVMGMGLYDGFLYDSTAESISQFVIPQPPETLVYSRATLSASSTETAMGKRGTAPLFQQGRKRPVGVIEVITRTTPADHKRRTVYTSHLDCTITFFDHLSVVAAHFVYASVGSDAMGGVITSMSDAASGRHRTAKVTMTPKGKLMEVKVTRN
jgi:hypothetical protein